MEKIKEFIDKVIDACLEMEESSCCILGFACILIFVFVVSLLGAFIETNGFNKTIGNCYDNGLVPLMKDSAVVVEEGGGFGAFPLSSSVHFDTRFVRCVEPTYQSKLPYYIWEKDNG